jgi:predicted nucleic acid-binding protein
MADVAIDSSVAAKWVLPEADTAQAQAILVSKVQSGSRLLILDIALAEVANAIWVRCHRGLVTATEADHLLKDFLALPLEIVPSRDLLPEAVRLSVRFRRAVYDTLFVAVSNAAQTDGLTADEPLVNAVKADFPRIRLLRDWPVANP